MGKRNKTFRYVAETFKLTAQQTVEWLNQREIAHTWVVGQTVFCLHCDGYFPAERVAVAADDDEFPTCPVCRTSSPMDFADLPWWRDDLTDGEFEPSWLDEKMIPPAGTIGVLPRQK